VSNGEGWGSDDPLRAVVEVGVAVDEGEGRRGWVGAAVHGVAVAAVVLGLFYRWFAVADRYVIFLYEHLGATPFDRVTRGRYWMAGLVAAGMVMVGYGLVNWAVGRVTGLSRSAIVSTGHSTRLPDHGSPARSRDPAQEGGCGNRVQGPIRAVLKLPSLQNRPYVPPAWWRVWVVAAPAVLIGIPLITMRVNEPTLPPGDAAACVGATLVGLAFALMPGAAAAERPVDLVWTALHGAGLMPALLLVRALELPGQGLISPAVAWGVAVGGTLSGGAWLMLVAGMEAWRGRSSPSAGAILVSGLCVSYLLMPVVHHLLATPPGYRYITTSSNFFADHVGLQALALLVAGLLALGVPRLQGWRLIVRFADGRGTSS